MTQHYLGHLFAPRSVAVFGASAERNSLGGVVFANLVAARFAGAVYPINLRPQELPGHRVYGSLDEVGAAVDLAVIATPAETVPQIVEACGKRGVKAIALLSAGFAETGARGAFLERSVLASARRHGMRLLGAKCLGVVRPAQALNVSAGGGQPYAGDLALVSQSAAVCASVLDWAHTNDIGFSTIVSLGTAIDLDFGDVLDFLISDIQTRSILLHVERVRDARRFMSGLRAAARVKPVVVVKVGRHEEPQGLRRLGEESGLPFDEVFDAAITRAGAVRVRTVGDLFSAARVLAGNKRPQGLRLAVVANGRGPGVLAADRAVDLGLELAGFCAETLAALDRCQRGGWSRRNPIDLLGDADTERFAQALEVCSTDSGVDGILAILCPQTLTDPLRLARRIIELAGRTEKPILACWMGEVQVREARRLFTDARLPSFRAPEAAVEAFAALARHHQNRVNLLQTPGALSRQTPPDLEGAKLIIESALAERREYLGEMEAKALASAFRIPVVPYMLARSPNEALLFAQQIGFPVAMKVLGSGFGRRSECGGVMLNLTSAQAVRTAHRDLIEAVQAKFPQARIEGVSIERMQMLPEARELAIGVSTDPVFGPVISLGPGGKHARLAQHRAVALPPLNRSLIDHLLAESHVAAYLQGPEHAPEIDRAALGGLLERVSEMVCEMPWIRRLEINPCLVDAGGARVLNVRVMVGQHFSGENRYRHMAICPYPVHLVRHWQMTNGTGLCVRPIRPEDAEAEQDFVRGLTDRSRYLRFQMSLNELTPAALARFTQIDYDREMALVAQAGPATESTLIGEARYTINPDGVSCEFGLVVADAWRQRGVGARLMHCLMDAARERGLKTMRGEVLLENEGMRRLMAALGFNEESGEDEELVEVVSAL
ncbi:MAG: bifunctional acetate--CoA ligase family protein/GNAT family N-acetyltransferase [Betaproteobacteria bacterium]|nr:bifunctional acetate--CoA ligase family protein/GNAT family N-acetyltransferase [Betaproteobacteria bacterium]